MAANGIRPVFGPTDTQRFLWARAWARFGAPLAEPKPGCVMVFAREGGGGHVALYEGEDATTYRVRGGNQSDAVNVTSMPKSAFLAAVWPETVASPLSPAVSNFERVHPIIAQWEGGYSNHPQDSGGPTNWGITQARLSQARGRQVSAEEVKALTYAEALTIFRRYYWEPLRCDEMPVALALMTYNAGVNSGPVARRALPAADPQRAGLRPRRGWRGRSADHRGGAHLRGRRARGAGLFGDLRGLLPQPGEVLGIRPRLDQPPQRRHRAGAGLVGRRAGEARSARHADAW